MDAVVGGGWRGAEASSCSEGACSPEEAEGESSGPPSSEKRVC